MNTHYTVERNIEILIALMKEHKVRKVIASPGSTNISFVASIQTDPYFEIYSAPDERSAAYMACGLAASSGEPVALSCTGATASRNYVPGMTEAYYRKLPVLAITSTQHTGKVGNYVPQVIDRSVIQNDIANLSVQIPIIHDSADEWSVELLLNKALLELRHRGGGPVHINMTTSYPLYVMDFSVKELPPVRSIFRICSKDIMPELNFKKIAIFVGAHNKWDDELLKAVDVFCGKYNAVVLCDHTSNYKGEFGVSASLVVSQDVYRASCAEIDVLIHIGQVSGAYMNLKASEVWRVSPDGELRDCYNTLKYVFEMEEAEFFEKYSLLCESEESKRDYYNQWCMEYDQMVKKIPELPFSNIWIAQNTIDNIPSNSFLHLGILNSLRSWNFFGLRKDLIGFSNTGGFGIDGLMSSLLGSSLAYPERLHFLVLGDLAFFYDMNVLGNRHIGSNIRILLINNGKGTEFRNYTHFASGFGDDADVYIAAGGHYGNKSPDLVRNYVQNLGFEYMSASNKEEYLECVQSFLAPDYSDKAKVLEVFTDNESETQALKIMRNLETSTKEVAKKAVKGMIKEVLGDKGLRTVKDLLKK